MTHKDIADMYAPIYTATSYYDYFSDWRACFAVKYTKEATLVLWRGSITQHDWLEDFRALANPLSNGALGPVHPGFMADMEATWELVKQLLEGTRTAESPGNPWIVAGHSLGAAHADICTALAVRDGMPPAARIVWGEPLVGFEKFAQIVAGVPGYSYRIVDSWSGDHDRVTDVPIVIGPEHYVRPTPVIDLPGSSREPLFSPFRLHHFELYQRSTPETPVSLMASV